MQILEIIKKKTSALPLLSKALLYIAAFLAVVLIWAINFYYTWPEMQFSLMYLVPVAWVTWRTGRAGGVILAIASTVAWASMEALQNPFFGHSVLTYLNVATIAVLFLSFVFILAKLKDALLRETELSRTDGLTGIANRRAFLEELGQEIKRTLRDNHPMTVVYLDVDDFKTINDTLGHHKGDECLLLVAQTIRGELRSTDTIARMGGDEFAIITGDASLESRTMIEQRLAGIIEQRNNAAGRDYKLVLSVGVLKCDISMQGLTIEDLLAKADALMYEQKREHRSRLA